MRTILAFLGATTIACAQLPLVQISNIGPGPAGNGTISGNVTVAAGKTFTVNNTLTLSGTDGSTLNVSGGGTLGTGAFQPQTVLTGTANQIAVSNGGVGATTVSIATNPTLPGNATTAGTSTLTGNVGVGGGAPDATVAFSVSKSVSNNYSGQIGNTNASAGTSYGLYVFGGSNVSDIAFGVDNAAKTVALFRIKGNGDVSVGAVGATMSVKSGANGASGTVTLAAGTGTITSTAIDTNTVIIFSEKTAGGTPGLYQPLAAVSAGSATVTSAATDTSTYNWVALKVN